jgi:hypothetical protein
LSPSNLPFRRAGNSAVDGLTSECAPYVLAAV